MAGAKAGIFFDTIGTLPYHLGNAKGRGQIRDSGEMKNKSDILHKMKRDAESIFRAGIAAVDPETAIRKMCRLKGNCLTVGTLSIQLPHNGRIVVVGAGKAGAPMAKALESILGKRIAEGTVVVKYGHSDRLSTIHIMEAGHPAPDENGHIAAGRIMELVSMCSENDLVICLISGGGSSLLSLPDKGLNLAHKQETAKTLLACGASIHEINAIRKHLSAIKGGKLAMAAHPARVVTLMLSDVVGDDMNVIASGPTVPDPTTFADCMKIIDRYGIAKHIPALVLNHLSEGAAGRIADTPTENDPVFGKVENRIIAGNMHAIKAARSEAIRLGYETIILSTMIEGETRHVAKVHGAIAREAANSGHPVPAPACLLSGGETTVTLSGAGKGGRNQEFALAAAMDIGGKGHISVLSAGTDGTDGPTDAAGAFADSDTSRRANVLGLTPEDFLASNNSYAFFESLGDLFITGPTRTNVMDLRILLIQTDDEK